MQITSTEFQQKVGYYLDLADQGENIEIVKQKPLGKVYQIVPKKQKAATVKKLAEKKSKWVKLVEKLETYNLKFDTGGLNSVQAQRKARGYDVKI